MYSALAGWWPVLSSPGDYREEAEFYAAIINANRPGCRDVLELGSGGGNNASHLKKHFRMTLVDVSAGMLKVSRRLNPECRHARGDMRSVRLGRTFDAVFVHDAVSYLTSTRDLEKLFRTAAAHLNKGGCLLVVPDFFKETYKPVTRHGGHDRGKKSLRYLEWHFDPDPADTTFECHFAFLYKGPRGPVRIEHDRHVMGLFPKSVWIGLLRRCGFRVHAVPIFLSEEESGVYQALAALKK
jgi:SAM-dependent methyltransferase